MTNRTLLVFGAIVGLLAPSFPSRLLAGQEASQPPAPAATQDDGLAALAAKLASDQEGISSALAEDLIKQIELKNRSKYPATEIGKQRRTRDAGMVLGDIKAQSNWWAGYLLLEQKASRGQLTLDEQKRMDEFIDKLAMNLGDEKTGGKIDQVAARKTLDSLQSQIDPKMLATKEGQDAFFDKLRGRYALANPGGGVGATPVAGGLKDKIVSESQIIRQFEPGDPYLYKDGAVMITSKAGHPLALQMRGGYDDPKGLYGYLADVNNNRDVRGITFPLYPGAEKVVELHGEAYKITVTAEKVGGKDELVVHVLAADAKGNPLQKEVEEPGKDGKPVKKKVDEELTTQTVTVYGTDGLMEKSVRKAVEGHDNGDGSKERYVAWLGEGEARRKFYVVPQGGAKAGAAYYDAEKLDKAYDAIINRKQFSESLMKPSHVFAVSESKNGMASPLDKDNASVVEYAGIYYQYQWNEVSGAMEIKKVSKPQPKAVEGAAAPAAGAAAPAAGAAAPAADGAPTTAPVANAAPGVDPDYPAKLRGPIETETEKRHYTAKQHEINTKLKELGFGYRIYASANNAYFAIPAAIKDSLIPQPQMDGSRLPAPESEAGTLSLMGHALVADTPKAAFLFRASSPLTVKDMPKGADGAPDMAKVDIVFKDSKEGDTTFRVSDLYSSLAAMVLSGFSPEQAADIGNRIGQVVKNGGGESKFKSVQGTKTSSGQRIFVRMEGQEAVMVWPNTGAAPAGGKGKGKGKAKADGEEANAEPAAKPGNEPSYHMPDTPLSFRAAAPGVMEDKIVIDAADGKKTLYRDFEDKMKHVAIYRDKEASPKNKKDATWYVRWHPMKTKGGKSLAKASYPGDFELAGQASAPKEFPYRDGMGFNPLIVEDAEDIGHVIMRSDPKAGHENAYAFFLTPYDDNHKHEMFLGHAMYKGVEPKASDHK